MKDGGFASVVLIVLGALLVLLAVLVLYTTTIAHPTGAAYVFGAILGIIKLLLGVLLIMAGCDMRGWL